MKDRFFFAPPERSGNCLPVNCTRAALLLMMGLLLHHHEAHAQGTLDDIAQISATQDFACALTTVGGVKCWGRNGSGQLGDGTTTDRSTPVDVIGLNSGVSAIAAGSDHSCALTNQGGVKCWGGNNFGQLGNGETTRRLTPVDVSSLTSGIIAISANSGHTCALTVSGGVKCWGDNFSGQLGDGSTTTRLVPVDVSGLTSGIIAISAGSGHSCALTTTGGVKCWGQNFAGQLGNNSNTNSPVPVDVSGLAGEISVIDAGGVHTCAVTTSGVGQCWGLNSSGQLGDGSTTNRLIPVDIGGLNGGIRAITAGAFHTCALTTSGGAKCWGSNLNGRLGDGNDIRRLTPVDVSGLTNGISAIAAANTHTCALTISGGVKCWGGNDGGQLGDITNIMQRLMPIGVSGLTGQLGVITAGADHNCALSTSGGVKCWGYNWDGQLGDGTDIRQRFTAIDVIGLANGMTTIAAGVSHTCALTNSGGVKCWGSNEFGQLGDGTNITRRLTPVDVSGMTSGIIAIAAGFAHSCALTTGGGVKCWGNNSRGQLGNGSGANHLTPVDVSGLTGGIIAISAGHFHTCALTTGGGVKCWGLNAAGQLGDNTGISPRPTPVDVSGLTSGISAISLRYDHTCALTTSGGVKCWGLNGNGQLGDGSTTNRPIPVNVVGLASGIGGIATGQSHTCALTTGGGVKCWGFNGNGQLGDSSNTQRLTPVDVSGFTSEVSAIAAGFQHTCALTTSSEVRCWGLNNLGQLGGGRNDFLPSNVLTSLFFSGFERAQ